MRRAGWRSCPNKRAGMIPIGFLVAVSASLMQAGAGLAESFIAFVTGPNGQAVLAAAGFGKP